MNESSKMIKKILSLASSLGKIEYRIGKDVVGLYKNQVMFGKIKNNKVYFINSQNKFDKMDIGMLDHEDVFITQAQKSYSYIE